MHSASARKVPRTLLHPLEGTWIEFGEQGRERTARVFWRVPRSLSGTYLNHRGGRLTYVYEMYRER